MPIEKKFHVGKGDIPRECVAKPGNCPKANPLAHFQSQAQAEEFNDRYNELYAKGYDFVKLDPDKDIKGLEDVELTYISTYIKEHAKENEEYPDYHNKVRWQITNRNNAVKSLKSIDAKQKKDLSTLADIINSERDLRFKEKKRKIKIDGVEFRFYPGKTDVKFASKDKAKAEQIMKGEKFKSIKEERERNCAEYSKLLKTRKAEMERIFRETKKGKEQYRKDLAKKQNSEDIIYEYMEKRIRNKAILDIEESVDNEIETRALDRGLIVA